ncbi:sigma-70 family RNA polymerase sigma factor [Pseudomonas sp. 148P]|uniref:Sigma-70 family RNA polymerase sigma factor n=1 Tax=Pseudomonas ulcerans TaxID=3115852 RepID=A0ABU7HUB4_9PSED|nr:MULTISPECIES: sigma-70 family RNA polymerase sigma factor [unclassified Pseudomonas]MEE1923922.1 sigma-70 family RNA polymerase sigma factor [Pseudomonas sp. 147P]MEE1935099.1 sigma-70 family RNA polymerase sigma factor [Pseudomonas sp. 148P]
MNWNRIDLRWAYTDLLLSLGRRTGCMHLAYDVLHDAFIRYLVADRQTRIEQPNAYLRRVAQTVLIDHFRQSGRFCSLESSEGLAAVNEAQQEHFAPSAEHLADMQQRLDALQRVINCLPPRCREVFWLARIEGHRQPEIARLLGISLSAVERHLIRALLDLRAAREQLVP